MARGQRAGWSASETIPTVLKRRCRLEVYEIANFNAEGRGDTAEDQYAYVAFT